MSNYITEYNHNDIEQIPIGKNQITKHYKYKDNYKPSTLYWGLGIENEIYLEFEKKIEIKKEDFFNNHQKERYSINYYENYKSEYLKLAFDYLEQYIPQKISVPHLLNSHSFTKTDYNNEPKTLYKKIYEINPKFNGSTLIETLNEHDKYFEQTYGINWIFDGDSIEFTTNNFFNTTLKQTVIELNKYKVEFIEHLNNAFTNLNIFQEYGQINIMSNNYNFAMYHTNLNNIAMFNNGTLNYNITLPTQLDANGQIMDRIKFINDHKNAIKIIQWLEPFILAIYGSPDVFAKMNNYKNRTLHSMSSQRCAISRYIGIGTYDTDKMESGKILTSPISKHSCNALDYWWFTNFYKNNAYKLLDEVGYDINFNKHYNHVIEIRFFDHILDDKDILESFEFIIYLMDHILNNKEQDKTNSLQNPIKDPIWNNIALNAMIHGKNYNLTQDEINVYNKIFDININKNTIEDVYYEIYWNLTLKYNKIYRINNNNNNNRSIRSYFFKPSGNLSKLTLNILNHNLDEFNIDKQIIDNMIQDIDIDTYFEEITDKKTYCCNCIIS